MLNLILLIIAIAILLVVAWTLFQQAFNKDTLYIRRMLRQAVQKNAKVGKYLTKWRMWRIWFKVRRIHKLNEQIIGALQKDKQRFPLGEKFFSLYLDSTLQVLHDYAVLVSQPVRGGEIQKGLSDSEQSLDNIIKGLESELTTILSAEIQNLEIEKEVLKRQAS